MAPKPKLKDAYNATLRCAVARRCLVVGAKRTATEMEVEVGYVRYWTAKLSNPALHPGSHGGARNRTFNDMDQADVEMLLFAAIRANPLQTLSQVRAVLAVTGVYVTMDWIRRTFHRWGWSRKRSRYLQINKFSTQNILYTAHYLLSIRTLNPFTLKYLDESHFDTKDLRRAHGWSERGQPISVVNVNSISETYSVTAVTTLSDQKNPVVLSDFRVGTNSAIDFYETVYYLIADGILVAGDHLIVDNASIHRAAHVHDALSALLAGAGVRLIFLPAYSPEYNPIELVFGLVKRHIRTHRYDGPFVSQILIAFALVTFDDVVAFYDKCLSVLD